MWLFSEIILSVVIIAFVLEFFDITLGMGYGTALSPVLLIMNFKLLDIVSALLINNVIIGVIAAISHEKFKNINFRRNKVDVRITAVISGFGIAGVLISVFVAVNVPERFLVAYIGVLVIAVGVITLFRKTKSRDLSYLKILGFGLLASFNKGMSGGGYGPVIVAGQIISGVDSRKAVAIATISEGVVSIAGALVYILLKSVPINWALTFSLLIGSVFAVPLAAFAVSKVDSRKLKIAIGVMSIILGITTLIKLFLKLNNDHEI